VKKGDIVKNTDPIVDGICNDDVRMIGTVMRLDSYEGSGGPAESIIEVLWSSGKRDWILRRRIEIVSEV